MGVSPLHPMGGGITSALARHKPWTASEAEALLFLRDTDHLHWPEIADQLGRTAEECEYRYGLIKRSHRQQDEIRQHGSITFHAQVPRLLRERDDRIDAKLRREEEAEETGNVTAAIFGDPLPGYSALDRRRA